MRLILRRIELRFIELYQGPTKDFYLIYGLPQFLQRILAPACLGVLLTVCLPLQVAAHPEGSSKRVLLLHSFAQEELWPSSINKGVKQALSTSGQPVELYVEHLNLVNLSASDAQALADFLTAKYHTHRPDLILLPDEPATAFFRRYREMIFAGTPLVMAPREPTSPAQLQALGANAFELPDFPDPMATLDLIHALMPEARTLVLIGNAPGAALNSRAPLLEHARELFPDVRDLSLEHYDALKARLKNLPHGAVIHMEPWIYDRQDKLMPPLQVLDGFVETTSAPIFGQFELMLGRGAVGGKMISGERRGHALGMAALQFFNGQLTPQAGLEPVRQSIVFDYLALQRFGLQERTLPPDSTLINAPVSIFESNPQPFLMGAIVLVVLLGLIVLLVMGLRLRRQSNRLLQENEQRYRQLFDHNPSAMLVYEQTKFTVRAANQAFVSLLGIPQEAIKGRCIDTIVIPEQRQSLMARARELNDGSLSTAYWKGLTRSGEVRVMEAVGQGIEFEGRPARAVLLNDVSQRMATEEALKTSELRLEQIIEGSPLPTVVMDADLHVTHWNKALESLTRTPASAMVGRPHDLGALMRAGRPMLIEALLQGQTIEQMNSVEGVNVRGSYFLPEGVEEETYHPDLGPRWLHSVAVPLRAADGRLLGGIQSIIDITELKLASQSLQQLNTDLEQRVELRTAELSAANQELQRAMQQLVQSEKLAALGGLVAGLAHELNTPIGNAMTVVTALHENLSAFQQDVDNNNLRRSQINAFMNGCSDACAMLERNTKRAADLVASFKQVAVDQTTVRRRRFRLVEALDETLRTLSPLFKRQPVTINLSVSDALEMDSFPGPLEQVVTNLVNNAVVHARGDKPALEIGITAEPVILQGALAVEISVQDDGIGMSEEVSHKVFDPFFTTRLGLGGSGLGLYVVYNLVTGMLGGQIRLHSTPGEGSCFIVTIPLQAPQVEAQA